MYKNKCKNGGLYQGREGGTAPRPKENNSVPSLTFENDSIAFRNEEHNMKKSVTSTDHPSELCCLIVLYKMMSMKASVLIYCRIIHK